MKLRVWLAAALVLAGLPLWAAETAPVYVETDLPPMVMLTPAERQRLVTVAQEPATAPAFAAMLALADASLDVPPQPLVVIVYEGRVSNDPDRVRTVRHLHDMRRLRALLMAYELRGDARYAAQAARYLLAWARAYVPTGNDVNENKLDVCFLAYRDLKAVLTEEERGTAAAWLTAIGGAQQRLWSDTRAGGNRACKRLKLVLLAAHVLERDDWRDWVNAKLPLLLAASVFADGTTADLRNRDAFAYHTSGLTNILEIAFIARLMDMEVYARETPEGGSVRKSTAYVVPYARGELVHPEWVNSKAKLDRDRWASGDEKYRPGKPWNPIEGYKLFLLASAFDPAMGEVATLLVRGAHPDDAWLAEYIRAIAPPAQPAPAPAV